MTKLETLYFTDVLQIPDAIFEKLGCEDSCYFEKRFLEAFAKGNPSIQHQYLVISKDKEVQALAIVQLLSLTLDKAPETISIQNKVPQSLQSYLNNKQITTAVFGNLFLSGNYGIFIKEGLDAAVIYEHIAQEIKALPSQKKPAVFFLKDFTKEHSPSIDRVQNHKFQVFQVEPNMSLEIKWPDFETYKANLRSKYRVKINKADSQSSLLTVKRFEAADIKTHIKRLQELYSNITDRAVFKTVAMQVETYMLLQERFSFSEENSHNRVYFNTYWYENKIVGFATAFKVGEVLDAHYVGIDYAYNKELSIYPRILNDYVRLGFDLGSTKVNLGRTSSEIKSTLGAQPENLNCYVRHRKTFANVMFKPLIRQLKMTEYKQHRPFKNY